MRSLTRLVAAVATVIAVCFAVAQLAGRTLFWQLPRFEASVNTVLASRGIRVAGLAGRWRGLNPGLRIERITAPGFAATGVDFELDLIESLGRNRVVARRLTVTDGRLSVEKTADGWRIPGARGGPAFDLWAFLTHSDQVWLQGRVVFRNAGHWGALYVETMASNQDGEHRFQVHVRSESRCAECALVVAGDLRAGGEGAISLRAQRFALGRELLAALGFAGLSPNSPLRGAYFDITLEGDWRRGWDGAEQARLRANAAMLGMPGERGEATIAATAWREGNGYRGAIEDLSLTGGEQVFRISSGGFRLRVLNGVDRAAADMWLPPVDISELLAPAVAVIGVEHPAGRWLNNVSPAGTLIDPVLRVDAHGLAFHSRGEAGSLTGRKGVPSLENITFAVAAHQRALRIRVDASDFELGFPDLLGTRATYQRGGGTLTLAFGPGFLGLRGERMWGVSDGMRAEANLAVARPNDTDELRVALDGGVDRIDVARAREYLPRELAPTLRRWLLDAVRAGELDAVRLLYRGHVHQRDALPLRRFELAANVTAGVLDYHADWPRASDIDGVVEVTGPETRARVSASAFDTALAGVELTVRHRERLAALALQGETAVRRLFDFAWATPVQAAMPWISAAWTGSGDVVFRSELTIPLAQGDVQEPLRDLRLSLDFRDATLDFADLGLRFEALNSAVAFEHPARLDGDAFTAELFGEPVRGSIATDDQAVRFTLAGAATAVDACRLLGLDEIGAIAGRFDFDAVFTLFPSSDRATELYVETDLAGVDVFAPAPLGKTKDEPRQAVAALQFAADHVAVSASYGDTSGWLHLGDEGIRTGAIGIGAAVPMIDADVGRVVFGGGIAELDAETMTALIAESDGDDALPFAWELRKFRIGTMRFDEVAFDDILVNGYAREDEVSFEAHAPAVEATLSRAGNDPWRLEIASLELPAPESDDDPLDTSLIDRLVAADVVLDSVTVGGEDYGSWRFGLRPGADGATLVDLAADIRGLRIESNGDLENGEAFWSKTGETRFVGQVSAGNIKEVLPLWGFAESAESESLVASGSLRWPGSPLNFDLAHLSGEAALELRNGAFLDVAPSGTRIMSLINFSTIAKRMSFDFTDVFGRGVSFERVLADLTLDDGLARFAKPAEIIGTGGSILITGTVDLDEGHLDNEMVFIAPVLNSNLPWYAAFLAFSNPAGAAGVWLGRQVFKDQIKRLSSIKYRVGGTYDEPQVEFVSLLDNEVEVMPPADEPPLSAAVN